jgi:hypothetical protein
MIDMQPVDVGPSAFGFSLLTGTVFRDALRNCSLRGED